MAVVRLLAGAGFTAYLAGGCVRDEVLGLTPTDYDVATNATPGEVGGVMSAAGLVCHFVGEAFGVMIVRRDRQKCEVATFRADGVYSDSRRPDSVVFSTPEEDAKRRDFTINAMFLDPLAEPVSRPSDGVADLLHGTLVDFVGGLDDLRARLIRAVGDPHARLREDHLRALRAVRFAARLGFRIDPGTAEAIATHALELAGVSRERIGDELRRMMARPPGERAAAMRLLESLGLDEAVFGARVMTDGRWPHLSALEGSTGFGTAVAAILLDRGADPGPVAASRGLRGPGSRGDDGVFGQLRRSLCLSNEEIGEARGALAMLAELRIAWSGASGAQRRRWVGMPAFAAGLALLRATAVGEGVAIGQEADRLRATPPGINPRPLLSGDDLQWLGWRPGPEFKRALDLVYDAQLEGQIVDRAQALELASRLRI